MASVSYRFVHCPYSFGTKVLPDMVQQREHFGASSCGSPFWSLPGMAPPPAVLTDGGAIPLPFPASEALPQQPTTPIPISVLAPTPSMLANLLLPNRNIDQVTPQNGLNPLVLLRNPEPKPEPTPQLQRSFGLHLTESLGSSGWESSEAAVSRESSNQNVLVANSGAGGDEDECHSASDHPDDDHHHQQHHVHIGEGQSLLDHCICTTRPEWKRLRLKRGVKYYMCRTCGAKWKVYPNSS